MRIWRGCVMQEIERGDGVGGEDICDIYLEVSVEEE